ncbi:hypothetical protein LSTR_LSTR005678 [Laodelphax striatellus]|uniref:Uncharacterized protein n=1 Tax=Laodelphax striatellus TaxID=195883 RepID=A0A482X8U8_LAOST|nr:hypothetical protein LSTR_LSTR005678 [Laodelphax striatellus]
MGPKRNGSSSTPSRQASSSISGSKPSPVTLDNSSLAEEILTNMRSQYGRRHSLRIFGVPEKANEDTDVEAMKYFKEKLGIDVQLEEINRSHRVGKPQPPAKDSSGRPRPRPIIIRFLSYRTRRRIFEAKSALKGTNITIREDLTKHRLRILNAAVDRFGVKSVWSVDGRIKIATNNGERSRAHDRETLGAAKNKPHDASINLQLNPDCITG